MSIARLLSRGDATIEVAEGPQALRSKGDRACRRQWRSKAGGGVKRSEQAKRTCERGLAKTEFADFLALSLAVSVSEQGKTPVPPDDKVPTGTLSMH